MAQHSLWCHKSPTLHKIVMPSEPKFYHSSFLLASSWHLCRHPREDVRNKSCVSGVSADFPVQLAMHLPSWSTGGLLRRSAARCLCVSVVLQSPRARHARPVADISRGYYVEFKQYGTMQRRMACRAIPCRIQWQYDNNKCKSENITSITPISI